MSSGISAQYSLSSCPTALLRSASSDGRPRPRFHFDVSLSVHGVVRNFASLTGAHHHHPRHCTFSLARAAPSTSRAVEVIPGLAAVNPGPNEPSASAASATTAAPVSTAPTPGIRITSAAAPEPAAAAPTSSTTAKQRAAVKGGQRKAPSAAGLDPAAVRVAPSKQQQWLQQQQQGGHTQGTPQDIVEVQDHERAAAPAVEQQQQQKQQQLPLGQAGTAPAKEEEEAGSPGPAGEATSGTEDKELVEMQARCWCAACHRNIPPDALAAGRGAVTCAGCHRCYHRSCAHRGRLGSGWAAGLPGWVQQLPLFASGPWYHCEACCEISRSLQQFAKAGEVEMPGIKEAMLDADTDEELPYYTLRLFHPPTHPTPLPQDPAFRQLVGVLRRHAPMYIPLVTPQDCMEFDYGLVVWRDQKPVAAAMFDVFGSEVAASPLFGARDEEARECLVELWGEVARDCGLLRVGLQVPEDDVEQRRSWHSEHGFKEMEPALLTALAQDIPAYAEELQVGTTYLVRDLYKAPEILRSPEDMQARFVEVGLNAEVAEKVGRKDSPRRRRGSS